MPEQLSQSQIDALLQKMNSGEVHVEEESRKVREYDFKSPKKFTKEQLKSLDSLHETFSRMLAPYFSGLLRTVCEIEVSNIEEQSYYEYNNALPDSALIGLVEMKPENKHFDDARMMMDIPTSVGFYLVDRVLGGPGTGIDYDRDYTDIEIAILTNILTSITQRLEDTWNNHFDVTAKLSNLETNPRLLQIFAPEDIVVIVMMSIKLGDHLNGSLSICIPAEFLEQVIDTFNLRYTHSNKRKDPEKEEAKKRVILETVCASNMEIRAVFDEFKMSLKDIVQLQPDDVIPLNKSINSDITVTIDKVPWFTAKLGETKKKKAIKLQNIVNNGDEEIQWKNVTNQ